VIDRKLDAAVDMSIVVVLVILGVLGIGEPGGLVGEARGQAGQIEVRTL
jgi:hypothetical protein